MGVDYQGLTVHTWNHQPSHYPSEYLTLFCLGHLSPYFCIAQQISEEKRILKASKYNIVPLDIWVGVCCVRPQDLFELSLSDHCYLM